MIAKIPEAARGQGIERRQPRPHGQLPIEELQRIPALVVLERLPTPAMAVDRAGTILFANAAFCDMVGYPPEQLVSMNFQDFFRQPPSDDRLVALIGKSAERLVELRHNHGHSVWACMSKSAMRRSDDTVALVTFDDRTEELWLRCGDPDDEYGRAPGSDPTW